MEGEKQAEPKKERSPWMYTTFILAIVSLGLLVANMQMTGYLLGNNGITGNTIAQPTIQQQNNPPPEVTGGTVDMKALADNDPVLGDPNAPITIIEFSDFQCPFCGRFYSQTELQLIDDYVKTGKVRIIYRDFPLSFHPEAEPAALAAECANEQGKFWEFHDKVFVDQDSMSIAQYKKWAQELGLNTGQFNSCLDSKKYLAEVQKDFSDGAAAGVSGTPTFFINGQNIVGAQPYAAFKSLIDSLLAG